MSHCHTCGQRVSPDTQPANLPPKDEIASIISTTQRLGDLILSLNATRVKLLQRLNDLRASTSVLPPEILSTVFHYASPPTDFTAFEFLEEDEDGAPESHAQIALSAVSWHWRRVVLSTPHLWTNAIINVTRKNAQRKAQLVQLYLANAGNMTISLALHIFPGHWRFITKSELDPVLTSIIQGAQKFNLLSLCSLPKSWIPLLLGDFTHLKDLRLKWAWNDVDSSLSDYETTQISSFSNLRRLYLWGTPINVPSNSPCQSLTILRFFDVPLHISIQMLILCPNLIEYACYQSLIDFDASIPQLGEPMTFSQLKAFYSPCSATTQFTSILRNLKLPALEALGLELGTDASGIEELVSFITTLPTTWPILEISGYGYSKEILERIFQSLPPQVRSLHLPDVDCWNLGRVFKALCGFDTTTNTATTLTPNMVGLQTIYIDSSSHSLQSMEDVEPSPSNPQLFLNMVEARKEFLVDGRFCLEIESSNEMLWEDVRERLDEMVKEGFKLRITMAKKIISAVD